MSYFLFFVLLLFARASGPRLFVPKQFQKPAPRVATDKLPKSLEAERSVLGAIVLNPEAILKVMPILSESDFFLPQNKIIYRKMQELQATGQSVDPVILVQALSDTSDLHNAGGAGYVSSLPDGMPVVSHVEQYANIVAEKSRLRKFIHACDYFMESAQREDTASNELVEQVVAQMLSLNSQGGTARVIEWEDAVRSAIEQIESDKANTSKTLGMFCGVHRINELTAGLRRKELAVIVGPTSNGKSLLAADFAVTSESAGDSGLFFAAEMTAANVAMREVSYEAGVPFFVTRRPDLIETEQIEKLKQYQMPRRLAIVDEGITPERIWALSEARKRSVGLDFVIVDYDQLVIEAGIDDQDEKSFFAHQGRFVNQAQKFAKRLDICMIIVAQMRKMPAGAIKGGSFRMQRDDIYGHSAIRNAPDVIIAVFRDFFLKDRVPKFERDAQAHVVKARNGQTGKVKMDFDPRRLRFSDKVGPVDVF